MSNNSTPKNVSHAPRGTVAPRPPQPRFVNTPWSTDPQTSRGIVTVNSPW